MNMENTDLTAKTYWTHESPQSYKQDKNIYEHVHVKQETFRWRRFVFFLHKTKCIAVNKVSQGKE